MTTRIYGYLRASTAEQNVLRAKEPLEKFASQNNFSVDGWFQENESGATLDRPELFRLLDYAKKGDAILIEQVDRISRLDAEDWAKLRAIISTKGIKVISLDLPSSHQFIESKTDEFSQRMLEALNGMMLDMLAAVARKDYEDRRRRQREGIDIAKQQGKYKGKQVNKARMKHIQALINSGQSSREIAKILKCGLATVSRARKAMNETIENKGD